MNSSLDHAQPQAGGFVWPAFTVHGSCASYKFNGTGTPSPARLRGVGLYHSKKSVAVSAAEGVEAPIGTQGRHQLVAAPPSSPSLRPAHPSLQPPDRWLESREPPGALKGQVLWRDPSPPVCPPPAAGTAPMPPLTGCRPPPCSQQCYSRPRPRGHRGAHRGLPPPPVRSGRWTWGPHSSRYWSWGCRP